MTRLRTLEGVSWDCKRCGSCCRHFELGPLDPTAVARLESLEVARHWPPAAAEPWFERRETPEGPHLFLRHVDDHCVFLREDGGCAIHAMFGEDAKPSFCRQFPFRIVRDERGCTAVVRPSCAGWHSTFRNGTPALDGARAAIAVPGARIESAFLPEIVAVVPGRGLPRAEWLRDEAALIERLADAAGEASEPVFVLREAIERNAELRSVPPNPERGAAAADLVLQLLQLVTERALSTTHGTTTQRAFVSRLADWIAEGRQRVQRPLPELTSDGRAYVTVVVRTFLATRAWSEAGSVAVGLGRLRFADWFCRQLASRNGEPVSAVAWSQRFVAYSHLVANGATAAALDRAEPAFLDVFRHL